MSSEWQGFPLGSMFDNMGDGWSCFLGVNPEEYTRYDSAYATCDYNYLLVLGYVVSNIVVIECIGRVLQSNDLVLGRAMAAAVFVSFLALGVYDDDTSATVGLFGSAIHMPDLVSMAVLLVGMEVYGRDPEPDVEAITNFSP